MGEHILFDRYACFRQDNSPYPTGVHSIPQRVVPLTVLVPLRYPVSQQVKNCVCSDLNPFTT